MKSRFFNQWSIRDDLSAGANKFVKAFGLFLNPSRLAVTEAVFGVLLAALAVELMVSGLAAMGVIGTIP